MASEPSKSRGWRFTDTEAESIIASAKEAGLPINRYLWSCHSNKAQTLDIAKLLRAIKKLINEQNDFVKEQFTEFLSRFEVAE